MRFAIIYGPHIYVSCLFALVASPIPVSFSLKVLGALGAFLSVLFAVAAFVDYIYQEIELQAPEISEDEISGEELPPPPRRESSKTVRVDEETHAVTWPDATITTTPEERQEYIGQIF